MSSELDSLCGILHAIYSLPPPSRDRVLAWRLTMRDVSPRALVAVIDDAPKLWPERAPTFPQVRSAAKSREPRRPQPPPVVECDTVDDAPPPWGPLSPRPWIRYGQLLGRYDRRQDRDAETDRELVAVRRELGIPEDHDDAEAFSKCLG